VCGFVGDSERACSSRGNGVCGCVFVRQGGREKKKEIERERERVDEACSSRSNGVCECVGERERERGKEQRERERERERGL